MFKVNGNPGPNLAHMDTQRNSDLYTLTGLILETRKVEDSIDTLRNCIFSLIPSFHRSTVSLGNGKKIENYLRS